MKNNKANHPPVSSESGEKLFFDEEGNLINQPTAPIGQLSTFTFKPSKIYVGRYCLGGTTGFCIAFEKKPNWFHRTMMKVCLGWEWTDVK